MSNTPQHGWDPEILNFMEWVEAQSVTGTLGPVSAVDCPFIPLPRLETYLKEGNRTWRLLQALFPHRPVLVGPEEIWRDCIKTFSILLLIGKGIFIEHFMQHQLWDTRLPFLAPPPQFPLSTSDEHFFESFSKTQWRFCPYTFRPGAIDMQLEKERILPIVHKQGLGDGGSALIYKIKLHPAYDYLTPATDIRRDPSYRYANTYALKTYRPRDAREHYISEVKTFRALISRGSLSKSIIGFYGSFVQDGSYNVLLEYADRGTLEQYLDTTRPPTTGEDVYKFWSALFGVIEALDLIHHVWTRPDPNDPPVLQGWHGDVKSHNILVVSGKGGSRFDCEFKLADFGLGRTREYGTPERYRSDEGLQHIPFGQSDDMWSLGCVFSEVAVWVVHGQNRLEAYRRMRDAETKQISNFEDIGSFHDGARALQSVGIMHEEVFDNFLLSDHVTEPVVQKMIREMLDEVDGRPNTRQLRRKSQIILRDAEKKLKSFKGTQKEPDIFVKGYQQQASYSNYQAPAGYQENPHSSHIPPPPVLPAGYQQQGKYSEVTVPAPAGYYETLYSGNGPPSAATPAGYQQQGKYSEYSEVTVQAPAGYYETLYSGIGPPSAVTPAGYQQQGKYSEATVPARGRVPGKAFFH